MRRLLLPFAGRIKAAARLCGSVRDAVRAARTVLPRAGRRDRVDKAAEQEVIRLISLSRAPARRAPAAGREKNPRRIYEELGFAPPGRVDRELGFVPPGRPASSAQAMELLGFARRPDPARGDRHLADPGAGREPQPGARGSTADTAAALRSGADVQLSRR